MSNQNSSYTVNVVRGAAAGDTAGPTWYATVAGVDGAVVRGDDFEDLEAAVRRTLAELAGEPQGTDPELVWQIDSDAETSRQVPLNPM
ncbi:hypothetical protein [Corynebacterium kalidii]|uniref:Uncharacterized protein n=1 Tax=Corynebacterium kalidii TaxID=2931982 RepID=A0A9X1WNR5_9CORY|nr:hypothetical protein [Corynebacterium kalidii]MCJ7858466.1 hypothetical protein [Corynebacterium kalidii]